jgi:hypothetical protein
MITTYTVKDRLLDWPHGELNTELRSDYLYDGGLPGVIEHLLWGSDSTARLTFHDFTVTLADHRTGREGDWQKAVYVVLRVETKEGEVAYFRQDGTYASHSGTDWDGKFYQVTPATETVQVWEAM